LGTKQMMLRFALQKASRKHQQFKMLYKLVGMPTETMISDISDQTWRNHSVCKDSWRKSAKLIIISGR